MSVKHSRLFAGLFLFTAVLVALFPPSATAAWQLIATETGKRVEIDRESIVGEPSKTVTVTGRIVLDRVIVDPRSAESFRIIEVQNRFDCAERTQATLKRSYFKDGDILLRSEEIKTPMVMPVRSNTPDDRMLREACRPLAKDGALVPMQKTVAEIGEVSGDLRRANETLIAAAVQQDLQQLLLMLVELGLLVLTLRKTVVRSSSPRSWRTKMTLEDAIRLPPQQLKILLVL